MATHITARPLGALGRMSLVAAIHAAVLLAIMRSLGIGVAPADLPDDMTMEIHKETTPPDDPQPLPRPDIIPRNTQLLPPPDLRHLEFEQEVLTLPPPDDTDFIERPPGGSALVEPQIVGARPDPRNPLSKPPYSARMIREGNQGTIEIEVFVQPDGRVSDARVAKSTGFEELDLAAMAEAKRNWRLLPATRDGVPVAQWHRLRVTFKLNER